MKAKWVRIELRKVETLPGGGVPNTFFDFVGQSPINLWQPPNDEYSTLHTVRPSRVLSPPYHPSTATRPQNDFPFFIRIPESIPPTIALEKGGELSISSLLRPFLLPVANLDIRLPIPGHFETSAHCCYISTRSGLPLL